MNGNSALLDSNIIIYLSKNELPFTVFDKFDKLFISVISYMEVLGLKNPVACYRVLQFVNDVLFHTGKIQSANFFHRIDSWENIPRPLTPADGTGVGGNHRTRVKSVFAFI